MKMTMKMKMTRNFKIAFLLLTGLISFAAYGQTNPVAVPTGSLGIVPQYNTGGIYDSLVKLPVRSFLPYATNIDSIGRIQVNVADSLPYIHNGDRWVAIRPEKYLDIRDFGAISNDDIDDSEAINNTIWAADIGIWKAVYFPDGVWNIAEDAVTLLGDIEYFGEGPDKTIIENLPEAETGLPLITPLDGATINPDIYTYRTMIATKGADYTVSDTIRNVKLHDIGIKWNGVNGGVNSVLPLAWVRIQDSEMYNVKIHDALPADLEDVNEERQGHGMLIGFAKNTDIHHNIFGASDYETVAIRYLSEENDIHHNLFIVDKPDTYHWQSHALQFARPTSLVTSLQSQFGRTQVENNYVYNNEFHLVDNVLHAVTSHSSKGAYVNNNYVEFYDGTLAWGFKFFDGTTNFSAIGNTFNAVNANTNLFPATSRGVTNQGVSFIGVNSTSNHAEVFNGIIANNTIDIKNTTANAATVPSYVAPIIGGNNISKGSNIIISGNNISIDGYDNYAKNVFGLYGDGINLYGNTVKLSNPFTTVTSAGLQFLRIKDGKGINVYNNIVTGTSLGKGIVIDNTSFEDIYIDPVNYQCAVAGDILTTGLTNQNEITVKPLTVNNTKADANGNITIAIPTVDTVLTDGSGNAIANNAVVDGLALKQTIPTTGFEYWSSGVPTMVTGSSATVLRGDGATVARNPLVFQNATLPSTPVPVVATVASGDNLETIVNKLVGTTSATLDFPSTAAGTSSELTISVTGAADGDVVSVGVPNASSNANGCFTARVSATNTVTVKFNNYSSGAIDPASGTFKVKVFK